MAKRIMHLIFGILIALVLVSAVNAVNTPPSLSEIDDVPIQEDAGASDKAIDLLDHATDTETNKDLLIFNVVLPQSNPSLVNATIDRNFIDISAPAPNESGTSNVCVEAFDGEKFSERECFNIIVSPVNDAP